MAAVHDGLKLLVGFYANYGQLGKVTDKTGVPVDRLKKWLAGGELSQDDRDSLCGYCRKAEGGLSHD